jgi:hypothetical protein
MTLVLALTAGLLASEAVPEPIVQAVEQVESSGRGAATPLGDGGKARGPLQWHAVAWADCSKVRRKAGLAVWSYSSASDPVRARDYARTWLTVLKVRLASAIGRQPLPGEIWLAWNLGLTGFSRYGFQWAEVPSAKFAKARQVNTLAWGLPKQKPSAR